VVAGRLHGVEEPVRGQVGPCCQRTSLLWEEEHQRRALEVVTRPEEVGLLSHEAASHVRRLLLVRVRVLHHPVLADEALAAHVAGEGLLPSVKAHVASQISFVVELLRTDFTFVRLVSSVLGQVLLIQQLHWKPLPALRTLKWLFSIMETFIMLLQVTDFLEYFVAFVAPELPDLVVQ